MSIVIGVLFGAALLVTLAATVLTDVKIWRLVRESHRSLRELPPERRRRTLRLMAATYLVAFGYIALILAAPFGLRKTLTYFVIVPFVLIVPVGVIVAGMRGYRGQRRGRPPDG